MNISIATPTHSAKWLRRLAWSIAQQSVAPFEWVILANGGVTEQDIIAATSDLKTTKVRILFAPDDLPRRIGALKRFALMACDGDGLMEVDHDDVLAPDCVAEVARAFDGGAEFVYSNMAMFRDGHDGEWEASQCWPSYVRDTRDCSFYNNRLLEAPARFDPCTILGAGAFQGPVHVRAWKRDLYLRLGGHDPAIHWTEDLEFLARLYIAAPKVAHIDRPLYAFYFPTGKVNPAGARDESKSWFEKHAREVVAAWCRRNGHRIAYSYADWQTAQDGTLGMIDLTPAQASYFYTSEPRAVMRESWKRLVHGGWLFVKSDRWSPPEWSASFGPTEPEGMHRQDRFKIVGSNWLHPDPNPLAAYGLDYAGVADKGGEPLAGPNFWRPRINDTLLAERGMSEYIKKRGIRLRFEDGMVIVDGREAEKAVAELSRMFGHAFVTEHQTAEADA